MTPDKSLVKNILVYAVLLTHVNSDILFFFSMLQSGISINIEKYITILSPAVFISDSVKLLPTQVPTSISVKNNMLIKTFILQAKSSW